MQCSMMLEDTYTIIAYSTALHLVLDTLEVERFPRSGGVEARGGGGWALALSENPYKITADHECFLLCSQF